jgi:uncharacterized lipoprotein YmbA
MVAAAALLAACLSAPKERFYTLSAAEPAKRPAAAGAGYWVAVGPVTLPELVDRPQLVIRVGPQRVAILEEHRWAEPLKSAIPQLVAHELAARLGGAQTSVYHASAAQAADYRVLIDIQLFEARPGEEVRVEALWQIRGRKKGGDAPRGRTVAREPVEGEGYEAIVAAQERALATLSLEIAAALRARASKSR